MNMVMQYHGQVQERQDSKVLENLLHSQHKMASEAAAKQAMEHGMKYVDVTVKGPGAGREAAIRALQSAGLEVTSIKDVTPVPHNGCRPPKRRRV